MAGHLTRETPAPGLVVWQPARAFRYAADAFWLAGFALEEPARTAVDLGTGSGIVAALLASRGLDALGIDERPEWQACWDRTLRDSAVRFGLRRQDVRELTGSFDLAVANPPYFPRGSGPVSPDPLKAAARTEGAATLADFVEAGLRVATRLCVIVPRERETELIGRASRCTRAGDRRSLLQLPGDGCEPHTADPSAWYALFRS